MLGGKVPFALTALAVGTLVAAASAIGSANGGSKHRSKKAFMTEVREDIVEFVNDQVIPGGVAAAKAPSGDLFVATASVQVRKRTVGKPAGASFRSRDVTGGGEYTIRRGATTLDSGSWSVKGPAQASLLGGRFSGVVDAIGHANQATGGRIKVVAHLVSDTGSSRDASLTLDCNLGSSPDLVEGFEITDGSVTYSQFEGGGETLIHRWTQRVR